MPDQSGTLETLALELGNALKPLKELLDQDIFSRLGVELPYSISTATNITNKLSEAAAKAGELEPKVEALVSAIDSEDVSSILSAATPLIATVGQLIAKIKEVGDVLHAAVNSLPPADKAKFQAFAEQLPIRIVEYMAVGYLDEKMPSLTSTLAMLGLVDMETKIPETLEDRASLPEIVPRRFYLDQIPKIFSSPEDYFKQQFKWGDPGFDGLKMLQKIQALLESFGLPADLYQVGSQPSDPRSIFFQCPGR